MAVVWITREIAAPAERAWDELVDVRRWPAWGPTVAGARLDTPDPASGAVAVAHRISAGATGQVRAVVGPWVPFAVTGFEEGRWWAWRVAGVPATSHRVERLGDRRCRVGFEVPTWAAPYAAVCAVALRRIDRAATSP